MKNNEMNLVPEEEKQYSDHVEMFELANKIKRTYGLDISNGPRLRDILFSKLSLEEESHPPIRPEGASMHA